jgi:phage-related protein (TIGR01555 family)
MSDLTQNIQIFNSLSSLVDSLSMGAFGQYGVQLSQTDTLFINNRWYLISNLRQLLSELYVEHGIVQTLVDQPVDDAFRGGFEIKTDQLSKDEVEQLQAYMEKDGIIRAITQSIKWARLYGGGAVILITDQPASTPLNLKALTDKSPIEFRAVDMWELYSDQVNVEGRDTVLDDTQDFFHYYGVRVHPSRVYKIMGKQAPAFIRPRLRGWGMSELERLVRSLNQYMKNQDVVFDLLDEAKVDIYKMKNFNSALMTPEGTTNVSKRIQSANMIKNYNNALTMDTDDEYEQKQINFAGLSDMLIQIRQGIAADLKMPVTKLFGISAAGFNSGEDDIENYNSMIESEIRSRVKFIVLDMIAVCCQRMFGMVPDDMKIEFPPLRILGADQEQQVKDRKFNRVMSALSTGVIKAKEAKQAINKDGLLPIEIDESDELGQPIEIVDKFDVSMSKT